MTATVSCPAAVAYPPSEAAAGLIEFENELCRGYRRARRPVTTELVDPDTTWSLQELLDAAVMSSIDADGSRQRAQVGYLVMRSGHTGALVVCEACDSPVMSVERFLFDHYVTSERRYRDGLVASGGSDLLYWHHPGSVRPLNADEQAVVDAIATGFVR